MSVVGISPALQHCNVAQGDIDITRETIDEYTNLKYLSSNNAFLCPESVQRWQQLLSKMAKATGKGSLVEYRNNGENCGFLLIATMVIGCAILFAAMSMM
ncbi:hypothetical protein COOONC_07730 [Cooperia oncophora]